MNRRLEQKMSASFKSLWTIAEQKKARAPFISRYTRSRSGAPRLSSCRDSIDLAPTTRRPQVPLRVAAFAKALHRVTRAHLHRGFA